jgi:nucleotide-binding universal stress UspA family protein
VAEAITEFAGSMPFVYLHAVAVEPELELKTNTELASGGARTGAVPRRRGTPGILARPGPNALCPTGTRRKCECTSSHQGEIMTNNFDSHRPVVVGVDGSPHATLALDWAAAEAALRGVPLVVLQTSSPDYPAARSAGPGEPVPPQPRNALHAASEHGCAEAVARARGAHPTLTVSGRTVVGDPRTAIVEASTTADLVVVGARGLGRVRGLLMGSVSMYVTPRAHCPVVVVREGPSRSLSELRVVVGVDGAEDSMAALRFAFEAAARHNLGLTVVHTWDLDLDLNTTAASLAWSVDWQQADDQERAVVAESVAGFAAEFPTVDVCRHVVRGHPVAELVRQSANAALLVLGTRGRRTVKGMVLGSVSQSVLHEAHCPVAVIRSTEQVPVERVQRSAQHEFHPPVPPVRERL